MRHPSESLRSKTIAASRSVALLSSPSSSALVALFLPPSSRCCLFLAIRQRALLFSSLLLSFDFSNL
jgi:hypothetical protein